MVFDQYIHAGSPMSDETKIKYFLYTAAAGGVLTVINTIYSFTTSDNRKAGMSDVKDYMFKEKNSKCKIGFYLKLAFFTSFVSLIHVERTAIFCCNF
eukprot:g79701.t1